MENLTLQTEDSIHANGKSNDVWSGNLASVIRQVEVKMMEDYNMSFEPKINVLNNVELDGVLYTLCEAYFDSGSDDYYYFAVK